MKLFTTVSVALSLFAVATSALPVARDFTDVEAREPWRPRPHFRFSRPRPYWRRPYRPGGNVKSRSEEPEADALDDVPEGGEIEAREPWRPRPHFRFSRPRPYWRRPYKPGGNVKSRSEESEGQADVEAREPWRPRPYYWPRPRPNFWRRPQPVYRPGVKSRSEEPEAQPGTSAQPDVELDAREPYRPYPYYWPRPPPNYWLRPPTYAKPPQLGTGNIVQPGGGTGTPVQPGGPYRIQIRDDADAELDFEDIFGRDFEDDVAELAELLD